MTLVICAPRTSLGQRPPPYFGMNNTRRTTLLRLLAFLSFRTGLGLQKQRPCKNAIALLFPDLLTAPGFEGRSVRQSELDPMVEVTIALASTYEAIVKSCACFLVNPPSPLE